MKEFTLLGFIAHLGTLERDMHELGPMVIEKACEMVAAEAKRVIGRGYDDWPELKPETIAQKVRMGYAVPKPLLRDGTLRDSIEWKLVSDHEGAVGSDLEIALWQHEGTSRVPPRPFLAEAAIHAGPKIEKMAARAAVAFLSGGGLHSAELRELLHVLREIKHAAHHIKENVIDPLIEDEDEGRRR